MRERNPTPEVPPGNNKPERSGSTVRALILLGAGSAVMAGALMLGDEDMYQAGVMLITVGGVATTLVGFRELFR
jgi:hypothetical protein